MIKGEYRGASLGWLVVILVLLGGWALIWGPGDDEDAFALTNDCARTKPGSPLVGPHPTWSGVSGQPERGDDFDYPFDGEAVGRYPVIAPDGTAAFFLCLAASEPVVVTDVSVVGPAVTLTATLVATDEPRTVDAEPLDQRSLAIDLWAEADHCGDGWAVTAAEVALLRSGSPETHSVDLNGEFVFEPDRSLCVN